MNSLNIDKIVAEYIFNNNGDTDINKIITKILSHCKKLRGYIHESNDNNIIIQILFEYLYVIDNLYKSIGLMQILYPSSKFTNIDNTLEKFNNEFFSDYKMYEKLNKIKSSLKNNDDINALENILKKFIQKQNSEIEKSLEKINNIISEINTLMNVDYLLTVPVAAKKSFPSNSIPDRLLVNRQTYYYLQRKVKDPESRKIIEKVYLTKSEKCMNLLANLVIERHNYAKLSGYKTYFNLVEKSNGKSDKIKTLINDLIIKIESKSRKEIDRIYRELLKDGFMKKVDMYDIIYYYEKLKTKHMFSPNEVVKIIFEMINKYFGLNFNKLIFPLKLWSSRAETYSVTDSNGLLLGYLHLDLEKIGSRKTTSPVCVNICHQYKNIKNIMCYSRIAIIAGYSDLQKRCLTYSDVIYLFREFGCAIQYLSHLSTNGLYFINHEFNILFPQIMEYIAWEKSTIEKICIGLDKTVVDHIIYMRYIDFCSSIKIRCINALFDHIIHNSSDIITVIKNTESNPGNVLKLLYKRVYSDVMSSQQDILNLDIIGINPTTIYQEINGSEGIVYGNVLTEILSFGVYHSIRNGGGSQFLQTVIKSDPDKLKKILDEYISKVDGNSGYNIYLHEIIGFNEIKTDIKSKSKSNVLLTESSSNQFHDTDDSDSNSDNIIQIDRKLNF